MVNLPVPNPRTAIAGEFETAAMMNAFRDAINFFVNVPAAQVTQTSTTSMANGGWTTVAFNSTNLDNYGGHSNSTNNSRYIAQVAGWYLVSGMVAWVSSSGNKWARIARNGGAVPGSAGESAGSASDTSATLTKPIQVFLNAGDYVELQGAQFTGGAINTALAAEATSLLDVLWVHS